MKKSKKILVVFMLITLILPIIFTNIILAADKKTQLTVVTTASETKYLENDQGYITKTIVNSNPEEGEVTIELKLSNIKKNIETVGETEIFLVVDNSGSMGYTTSTGEIRRKMIINAMENLINNIFNSSSKVKVGLVRFAARGELLSNGTALMCNLTDNKQTLLNAVDEYKNLDTSVNLDGVEMMHCESGTNIEAGIKKANDNFSESCQNKIIILLTDGIPNASILYSTDSFIYNATKERLKTIGNSGVLIISMMTGITEEDEEGSQDIVEQIFGTEENPTTGKFYNIADANLNTVITNDIFNDIMEIVQNPINNVKIVDYFPEDITENFEFSYINKPDTGEISDKIDEEDKTITWDIGTLRGNEVATLKYKLKLKDMQNEELLNKVISTNEKVVLTYEDVEDEEHEVILTSSPKIKLEEVKEEPVTESEEPKEETPKTEEPKKDDTIAVKILPNTGKIILLWTIGIITITGIVSYIRYRKLYIK